MTKPNPFKEKARRKSEARALAIRNHRELAQLLARYTDEDDQEARARVAARVQEAREAIPK